jgi:hypothetical protein
MLKTSKVKSKQSNGTYNGNYGLMYKWEIEMEDGNVGESMTKDEAGKSYQVGEEIEYDCQDGQYPKINRNFSGQQSKYVPDADRENSIFKCNALNNAVAYHQNTKDPSHEMITSTADYFIEWLKKK